LIPEWLENTTGCEVSPWQHEIREKVGNAASRIRLKRDRAQRGGPESKASKRASLRRASAHAATKMSWHPTTDKQRHRLCRRNSHHHLLSRLFPPRRLLRSVASAARAATTPDGWPPVTFQLQCSEYLAPSLQSLTSYPVIYYHFWRFGATAKDHVDPPDPKPPSEQFLWFEPFLHSRMTPRLAIALTAANTASRLRASRALQDRAGLSPIIRP